ncbi:MAG: polysaccharide biosynthesis protein [Elusimicrobia bacterium]|nr:polysaccharide biosynthesis protein [Elusimicrobiota bacterium]
MILKVNPRRLSVILLDIAVVLGAWVTAFLLRFDFHLDPLYHDIIAQTAGVTLFLYFAGAQAFGLYRGIYHFSSFSDLINIIKAVASSAIVTGAAVLFIRHGQEFPRSVLVIHPVITFLLIGGIRFAIRLTKNLAFLPRSYAADSRRTLLIGAGALGESIARQMLNSPLARHHIIGFIDEDKDKWGMSIHACPVLGGLESLNDVLDSHAVEEIIVTTEERRGEIVRSIAESIRDRQTKPEMKIAPSLTEMLASPGASLPLRTVMPVDLLNRKSIRLDSERIGTALTGKCVLITGAGGTIGSELSRQCLLYRPARLVLLDNHATSLFYIEACARKCARGTEITAHLGDIRDRDLVESLFSLYQPQVILHAAAHKHVSQLESNVQEAVSNNLLGTCRVAEAAARHRAESFLLISTDKAVRPAGVMGASKRAAELAVLHFSQAGDARFAAVRFGNVLGSSGSVLELFREQISRGGPLIVTHPDATRYFMTVEEAVQLVLQALSLGRNGDIFVLRMGMPVKILDMAKNLALLSGLTPGKDIQIEFIGLRPGEKLSEELVEDPAGHEDSGHPDIMVLRNENKPPEGFQSRLSAAELACRQADPLAAKALLHEMVPTFQPNPY